MSVEITIVCDGCAGVIVAAKSAGKARQELREQGGKAALEGGKDLCAECVERGIPPE